MLLWHLIRHEDLVLLPVLILDEAHTLHLFRVVGVVVDCGHRAELVKALNEHPCVVEVCEAHRPLKHFLTPFLRPIDDGTKESIYDLIIVDEVYEAEASIILIPRLIGSVVYDASDTPYDTSILVGKEVSGFAELKGGVSCWV